MKFPTLSKPETLEARYGAVMNDVEIDLMKAMLEMDPHKRITAREAIDHEYFDQLRANDPEYCNSGVIDEGDENYSEDKDSVDAMEQAAPAHL